MRRKVLNLVLSLVGPVVMIIILTMPIGPLTGGLGIIAPSGGIFDVGLGVNDPKEQTIYLTGLDARVEVAVDQWGIPHIYAESSKDAFMALGYLHAKERLFQMVLQNHLAGGRISEIVGGYANSSDKYYRTIGLNRAALKSMEWFIENADSNPDVAYALELIDAEVEGVNAFINSMTSATTPIEFKILGITPEPWTRYDVFLWTSMMSWSLSGSMFDFQRLWLKQTINNDTLYNDMFPDELPYVVPIIPEQYNLSIVEYPNAPGGKPASPVPITFGSEYAEEAQIPKKKLNALMKTINDVISPFGIMDQIGSNNWVVHGSRTSTGMPILANDPHLVLQAPSLWYEAHIVVPGELNVMGVTFPGLPGIVLGHNDHIAWGFTNVGADVLDIFVEQLNPSNPDEYMYNGEYREFQTMNETIHTKEGVDIPFQVKASVHGPLIDSIIPYAGLDEELYPNLAMNWTGGGVTTQILGLTKLNQATNLKQYHDALYWWDSPAQNIIYADDQGNIAITVAGRLPIRAGYTGELPVVATSDNIGMVSNIPFAYNPRSINPSQGYLQSANQRSIDPANYGFPILGPFADCYRGRRINHLLSVDNEVTVDDMKRFQADSLEVRAQEILPFVIDAWNSSDETNSTIDAIMSMMSEWDYVMDINSSAPTFWLFLKNAIQYEVFDELRTISSTLPLSRMPVLERILKTNDKYYLDDHTTPQTEDRNAILVRAIYRAFDDITSDPRFGSEVSDWRYGDHHIILIRHIAGLTYIGGGPHRGQNTLNNAGGWVVGHGPSWRMVADLSNIRQSYGVYPGGQSGNMFSPHWDDLFNLWYDFDEDSQQYNYHLMYFYATYTQFIAADIDSTMIERTILFIPGG